MCADVQFEGKMRVEQVRCWERGWWWLCGRELGKQRRNSPLRSERDGQKLWRGNLRETSQSHQSQTSRRGGLCTPQLGVVGIQEMPVLYGALGKEVKVASEPKMAFRLKSGAWEV